MCVVTINKLNFRDVEKREELQCSDLTELLGWALLLLLWSGYSVYKLPHNLNQNFLKFQTKKKIKLLARIIYYIMFPCVFYQVIRQNTTKIIPLSVLIL